MNTYSLFPDYAVLENGRNEAQAMRLALQLHEVDLQMLVTDSDRRLVVSRLRSEGIADAMQLILLTEEEVRAWYNVGPVFVDILAGMQRQVIANPEEIVDTWHNQHRLLVLPDDLCIRHQEDDFFGMPMVAEDEANHPTEDTFITSIGNTTNIRTSDTIILLERCLTAAIDMMDRRWGHRQVLRKYYIDGLPAETIVGICGLPSPTSLTRIIEKKFRKPLLSGYQVKGIQFSDSLLKSIKSLRKSLLYAPAAELDVLSKITPVRFLEFLGLTLLQRSSLEAFWGGDYIVGEGEVERCRRTQRYLFSSLQFRVVSAKEQTIKRGILALKRVDKGRRANWLNNQFLRVLLCTHPCIENSKMGFRLVPERLNYECTRLARIVYDAHSPLTITDIMTQYEHQYMQRPQLISISDVRKRFPRIHSIRRGVWEWK